MKATASIVIEKPISEVWDFVSDITNMEKWVNGVSDPVPTSEGEWGIGSTFRSDYIYAGKNHAISYVITEFDPPHRMSMRSISGPFPFEGCTELREEKKGTRVFNSVNAEPTNAFLVVWFALLGVVLRLMMRIQLRKELVELRTCLEGPETGDRKN